MKGIKNKKQFNILKKLFRSKTDQFSHQKMSGVLSKEDSAEKRILLK